MSRFRVRATRIVKRNNQNLWWHTCREFRGDGDNDYTATATTTKVRARADEDSARVSANPSASQSMCACVCVFVCVLAGALGDAGHENKVLIIQFTIFSGLVPR